MPRFLHTYTGEFHWVADPSEVLYAIISHTWRPEELGGEQSFASILELQKQVGHTTNTHSPLNIDRSSNANADPGSIFFSDGLSDKIKHACKVAREAGYQLIWIDSGCIDKSSSTELAEAINSMFELYRLADVCYVYLSDVPDGDDPRDVRSSFRQSRWHVRGWTLQELIAPKNVVFLTKDWTFLGTKVGLASTLEQVTRVDVDILVGKAPVDSASVARRMSWAATRETTRVEDEAYSLLGIFGVHLSPIYGEGRNAFLRLQEEILKYIPDQTIFAWGNAHLDMDKYRFSFRGPENRSIPVEVHYRGASSVNDPIHWHSLLAPSPVPFLRALDAVLLPPTAFAKRLQLSNSGVQVPPLRCVFTPQGVGLTFLTLGCAKGGPFDWIARNLHCAARGVSLGRLNSNSFDFDPFDSNPFDSSPFDSNLSTRLVNRPRIWRQNTSVPFEYPTRCDSEHTQGVVEYIALLQCEATSSGSVIALALLRPTSEVEQNMGLRVATRSCDCELGSRSCRLVYISPAALSTIRRHLVPTELHLRRNLPPGPPPTGSIPTWRGTWGEKYSASIILWPDLRTYFCVAPWCEQRLSALGVAFSPLQVHVETDQALGDQILLTSSLTSNNPSESEQAQGNAGAIKITLSLTRVRTFGRSDDSGDNASSRFEITSSRELCCSAEVGFDTRSIPVTPRERAIHEAVFEVHQDLFGAVEENQDQQQGRRLLRLSLECPPGYLYHAWMISNGSNMIPCLWMSIELSDILQVAQLPVQYESEMAISESPSSSAHPSQAPEGFEEALTQVLVQPLGWDESIYSKDISPSVPPLPWHIPTSMGLRGRLTPFKRSLGNASLQVLRQPKKLVESIRARGRRAEGSPPRS